MKDMIYLPLASSTTTGGRAQIPLVRLGHQSGCSRLKSSRSPNPAAAGRKKRRDRRWRSRSAARESCRPLLRIGQGVGSG